MKNFKKHCSFLSKVLDIANYNDINGVVTIISLIDCVTNVSNKFVLFDYDIFIRDVDNVRAISKGNKWVIIFITISIYVITLRLRLVSVKRSVISSSIFF